MRFTSRSDCKLEVFVDAFDWRGSVLSSYLPNIATERKKLIQVN